ncbi:unnamed protein product, partial [Ectocarpus fasciculatus]
TLCWTSWGTRKSRRTAAVVGKAGVCWWLCLARSWWRRSDPPNPRPRHRLDRSFSFAPRRSPPSFERSRAAPSATSLATPTL